MTLARILRSIGAVLCGFVAVILLSLGLDEAMGASGVIPRGAMVAPALTVLALACRGVITITGGWLTARLAPAAPLRHALVLGMTVAGFATLGVFVTWNMALGPHWYPIALAATAVPLTLFGGWLRAARWFPRETGLGSGR
ncbi:hypothetical protein [uncultured Sphingomonas sp.]|uniref:hypothetical protein n=1 Tax=uncultured Sphingomonas sp. TaxID=158754 RepID=UPI0035CB7630